MSPTRSPPKLKETPATKPQLLEQYQCSYDELITTYPKSRTLEIIGHQYGVSRQTVMYYLFPQYRQYQKKYQSKRWSYEKQNPAIRKRITDHKAMYMAARRHIDELVRESYRRVAPQEAMSLGTLREVIFEISGIAFQPSTLDGLIKRYEATKGYPLLVKISGYNVSHYRLSEQFHK
ncbi:MAG: hypothetical protein ABSB22_05100 [Thermodesulfobacteriota bacterium]|jgi:hypothetical protein